MSKIVKTLLAITVALIFTSCTNTGKLNQAIANANASLRGQDIAIGAHCDGFFLSGDTVILIYNYQREKVGKEYLESKEVQEHNRPYQRRGMVAKLRKYEEVARAMEQANAGFIYRLKYKNGKIDNYFSPAEVKEALAE